MDQEFVEKRSLGKIIGIISSIVLIIGLIIFVFYYIFFLKITPSNYLTKVSEKTSGYLNEVIDIFSSFKTNHELKTVKNTGTLKFNANEEMKFLETIKLDYNLVTSYQEEKSILDLNIKENDEDFFKNSLYLNKDSLYLKTDIYDKVIRLFKLDYNLFNVKNLLNQTYTINDLKLFAEKYIEYYFLSLQEIDMSKEDLSLKEIKYTYKITDNNIKKVNSKLNELCSRDDKLKNIDIPNLNLTEMQVEVTMNRFTKDISKIVITKDNEETSIVKVENNKYEVNQEDKIIIDKDKIVYQDYDKEVLSNSLELSKTKEEIRIENKTNKINMELSLKKVEDSNLRIYLSVYNNFEVKTSIDLDMDIIFNDDITISKILATAKSGEMNFEIEVNNTSFYQDKDIEDFDITNAIPVEELSEDETNKIYINFIFLVSNLDEILKLTPNV